MPTYLCHTHTMISFHDTCKEGDREGDHNFRCGHQNTT